MADTRILLQGLEEYHRVLGKHISEVNAEFQSLQNIWYSFSSVYDGNAADQFREGWVRTAARFEDYMSETQRISQVLGQRIESLREADKTESNLA